MSRPTNLKKAQDVGMLKAGVMADPFGFWGTSLYREFVDVMRGKGRRLPDWNDLNDAAVINSMVPAGKRWRDSNLGQAEIVNTYLREFGASVSHVKFQNLVGCGADRLQQNVMKARRSAAASLGIEHMINEADASCASLEARAEAEMGLDFVRSVLHGLTGSRHLTPAGLVVLRGVVGSLTAWARCVFSLNDPEVLRVHGLDAALELTHNKPLADYLSQLPGVDLNPILRMYNPAHKSS